MAAAFERFAGIDLLATVAEGQGDRDGLAAAAKGKVRITDDDTWSDIFSKVLVEHVEPNLGQGRLTLLYRVSRFRRRRWRAPNHPTRAWPNVLRFMPAVSNWPTDSAN